MSINKNTVNHSILKDIILDAGLSVRSENVLLANFNSINEILAKKESEFQYLRNCGKKTVKELLSFREGYLNSLKDSDPINELKHKSRKIQNLELNSNVFFKQTVSESDLSKRAKNSLVSHFKHLYHFLDADGYEILGIRNCGRKTLKEIIDFQEKIKSLNRLQDHDQVDPLIKHPYDFSSLEALSLIDQNWKWNSKHFYNQIVGDSKISVRAKNVLIKNVGNLFQFCSNDASKLIGKNNFYGKTLQEIVRFRAELVYRLYLGYNSDHPFVIHFPSLSNMPEISSNLLSFFSAHKIYSVDSILRYESYSGKEFDRQGKEILNKLESIHEFKALKRFISNYLLIRLDKDSNPRNSKAIDIVALKNICENSSLSVTSKDFIFDLIENNHNILGLSLDDLLKNDNIDFSEAFEILAFQEEMLSFVNELNITKKIFVLSELRIKQPELLNNKDFFNSMLHSLSKRARNVIVENANTLTKLLNLKRSEMFSFRNCGRGTITEILDTQKKFKRQIIEYDLKNELNKTIFYEELKFPNFWNFSRIAFDKYKILNDYANTHEYINVLIEEICGGENRERNIFLKRMGMSGEKPQSLEVIGQHYNLTRERVRQLLNRIYNRAISLPSQYILSQIVNQIKVIVSENGGIIDKVILLNKLFSTARDSYRFEYATPLFDFISDSQAWQNSNLTNNKTGTIINSSYFYYLKIISKDLYQIGYSNADEVHSQSHWSIDFSMLKSCIDESLASLKNNSNNHVISNLLIENSLPEVGLRIVNNRVYTGGLWDIYFGRLSKAVENFMLLNKNEAHFTLVFDSLRKFRPRDSDFSSRVVHAALGANENIVLWDRGTFIHKDNIQYPHGLIGKIEKWVLDKLKNNVPFVSAYGPYISFKEECQNHGINNEKYLYSLLKIGSHPLLAYPWVPYIYYNKGEVSRIPNNLFLEEYLQESKGEVTNSELENYALNELCLKDFQYNALTYIIPNCIRTKDWGFLHTDFLDINKNKIDEILTYVRNILKKVGHVSVVKVFKEKKLSCIIQGIDSPQGLYSIIESFGADEFGCSKYPKINCLIENMGGKKNSIAKEIISYIRNKACPISYQELISVFGDDLGYNENTIYSVRFHNDIFSYLTNCFVHAEIIKWDSEKQRFLEQKANERYEFALDLGKPFALIDDLLEQSSLPILDGGLYWSKELLQDILSKGNNFRIIGNNKNAYLPRNNCNRIQSFEDLLYFILKSNFDGAENLNDFSKYAVNCGIIKRNITLNMLGEAKKVKIRNEEIYISNR